MIIQNQPFMDGNVPVAGIPSGGISLGGTSGAVANAGATASLTPAAGHYCYVTGFDCTALGATAAANVDVQLFDGTGVVYHWAFQFPVGVTVIATPLLIRFNPGIRAGQVGNGWTVSLNAGGAGNTYAAANIYGYQV